MRPAEIVRLACAAGLLGVALGVQGHPAASAPQAADTQRIIDALSPRPEVAPDARSDEPRRTRSARNLIVREVPLPASEPPSLSMAVQFDFDSARLRPEGAAELMKLAAALRSPQLAQSRFLVEGHTDAQGSPAYNLRLSQSRADEVRRFLQSQGVAGERITTAGRGAQQPANPADPLAAENRRVHVVNLGAATP
jgi:OOP family OmpA-OmpF porin